MKSHEDQNNPFQPFNRNDQQFSEFNLNQSNINDNTSYAFHQKFSFQMDEEHPNESNLLLLRKLPQDQNQDIQAEKQLHNDHEMNDNNLFQNNNQSNLKQELDMKYEEFNFDNDPDQNFQQMQQSNNLQNQNLMSNNYAQNSMTEEKDKIHCENYANNDFSAFPAFFKGHPYLKKYFENKKLLPGLSGLIVAENDNNQEEDLYFNMNINELVDDQNQKKNYLDRMFAEDSEKSSNCQQNSKIVEINNLLSNHVDGFLKNFSLLQQASSSKEDIFSDLNTKIENLLYIENRNSQQDINYYFTQQFAITYKNFLSQLVHLQKSNQVKEYDIIQQIIIFGQSMIFKLMTFLQQCQSANCFEILKQDKKMGNSYNSQKNSANFPSPKQQTQHQEQYKTQQTSQFQFQQQKLQPQQQQQQQTFFQSSQQPQQQQQQQIQNNFNLQQYSQQYENNYYNQAAKGQKKLRTKKVWGSEETNVLQKLVNQFHPQEIPPDLISDFSKKYLKSQKVVKSKIQQFKKTMVECDSSIDNTEISVSINDFNQKKIHKNTKYPIPLKQMIDQVLLKSPNLEATKAEIIDSLKQEYFANDQDNVSWKKSVSQLLCQKFYLKTKGLYGFNKNREIQIVPIEQCSLIKHKVIYALNSFILKKAPINDILTKYIQQFIDTTEKGQPSQQEKNQIKNQILKVLAQSPEFDRSESKSKYTFNPNKNPSINFNNFITTNNNI